VDDSVRPRQLSLVLTAIAIRTSDQPPSHRLSRTSSTSNKQLPVVLWKRWTKKIDGEVANPWKGLRPQPLPAWHPMTPSPLFRPLCCRFVVTKHVPCHSVHACMVGWLFAMLVSASFLQVFTTAQSTKGPQDWRSC
jgi:hypothetical protein